MLNTVGRIYWFSARSYGPDCVDAYMLCKFIRYSLGVYIIEGPYIVPRSTAFHDHFAGDIIVQHGIIDWSAEDDDEVRLATQEECNSDAVKQLLLSTIR